MSVDRGFTWMDDETIALIDIFSKSEVQDELRGAKRNITVYEKVASELSNIGFNRTAYQCREKIKRLRKEYHQIKHCMSTNTKPKKPMKYFDLVDKIFSQNSIDSSNIVEINLINSETEEEIYPLVRNDNETDPAKCFIDNEHILSNNILPEASFSELNEDNSQMLLEVKLSNSPSLSFHTNEDSLFPNEDQNYDLSEEDSPLHEMDSPWVPNVVLVENSNKDLETTCDDRKLSNFNNSSESEDLKDLVEPPRKKKKQSMLKLVLNKMTESFLNYQTDAESRLLDRITQLEKERMKRDENMQKLWIEFEERRRKEEQEHEIKMLSLLGQFATQISDSSSSNKPT